MHHYKRNEVHTRDAREHDEEVMPIDGPTDNVLFDIKRKHKQDINIKL